MKRILVVCGTRPEGIKLAPVIHALKQRSDVFQTLLCITGQHREMLDPILRFFSLHPDFDLALMKPGQTLSEITSGVLTKLRPIFEQVRPDVVLVQGDTTTAFAGALAGFYERVKVGHIEAGLRTGHKYSPFPEEMNRILVTRLADYHFAPTENSRALLANEHVTRNVFVTGNTVTDALILAHQLIKGSYLGDLEQEFSYITPGHRFVLVTGHRRESFGEPFENICRAIRTLANRFDDVEFIYPMHLNPQVRVPVDRILSGTPRVHLIEPVEYPKLVFLLSRCTLVLTDSGGIQEEAPSFGKPVLVMRSVTERPEGITAGCAELVGTQEQQIVEAATRLLIDKVAYESMAQVKNPYGDGKAAERIVGILEREDLHLPAA